MVISKYNLIFTNSEQFLKIFRLRFIIVCGLSLPVLSNTAGNMKRFINSIRRINNSQIKILIRKLLHSLHAIHVV